MNFDHTYQYNFPTTIRFGNGSIEELGPYLAANNLQRPLLVTDGIVSTLPFFKKIVSDLGSKNVSVKVFNDIHKNPVKSDVYKGTDMYDATERDCIIGIGGGSPLDVARAILLRVNHREDLFKYDDLIGGDVYVTNGVPHFIAVPTTAGTGSEVGRSAIIADDETHTKRILFSPKLLAKIVFADPVLTMDVPPAVTAATGMDALTHNLEAFLAKMPHPMCEGIALQGMKLISESIVQSVTSADLAARGKMLLGSIMGAVAFQKGLGVVHSLAHPLSALLDTHHGLANAINLPYGMQFNFKDFEDKFNQMAYALQVKNNSGQLITDYLFELNSLIGIPHRLRDIGVEEKHIEPLSQLALADFAHPNNPKPVGLHDFKALYQKAY